MNSVIVNQFNVPVVVFFFKRAEKTALIIDRLSLVQPKKLYLISDGGRNGAESALVDECRRVVESRINWPCEVVRNYADSNRGVFDRIGLGAKWVLEKEGAAIFLEDDNLPEISFFKFCEEMLERYRRDTRVLWICGTNYLKEYEPSDGASYVFSRHMMPCGWASWKDKFCQFYDENLSLWDDPYLKERIVAEYSNGALCRQDIRNWDREKRRIEGGRPNSWDYQMSFSQRVHGLYAIVPKYNQISNIGVDEHSIHGGTTFSNIMTSRFCGLPTKPLVFPLSHPKAVLSDLKFESLVDAVVLLPLRYRLRGALNRVLKKILLVDVNDSLVGVVKGRVRRFLRGR